MSNHFSFDEAMEPYYVHHGMKQSIRRKLIRYGFKVWCCVRPHGFLVKFYPNTCVDLFDKLRVHCRIRIRSRKWYKPLFRFSFNGSIVNLWIPFRCIQRNIFLLEFTRQIVTALLAAPELEKKIVVSPKTKKQVPQGVRFDNRDHLVNKIETQRRCVASGKCIKFVCIKCNIGLHLGICFIHFHQKWYSS
uniref:PiggyBac transposable element-derived protein domain-containing protein n=1 Tax=Octopus bimaculoides TaxID=37653 RepID=A0A0L8GYG9_OCTBM